VDLSGFRIGGDIWRPCVAFQQFLSGVFPPTKLQFEKNGKTAQEETAPVGRKSHRKNPKPLDPAPAPLPEENAGTPSSAPQIGTAEQ
jgi:hypothetical protein